MVELKEYLNLLLKQETQFDNLRISLDGNNTTMSVPPIIKASVLLLDKMMENVGCRNVIIFPEKNQSLFLFVLMKLLHNISLGRIVYHYDPEEFESGEILKLGNSVVKYLGYSISNGTKYLSLQLSDLTLTAPLDLMPFLQRTNTAKKLSKYASFVEARKKIQQINELAKYLDSPVTLLGQYKSHMENSIYYMSPVISAKKSVYECWLDGSRVDDLILIGQANYEGKIQNIGPGQLKGVPAVVLAPDLYTVRTTISQGNPVQSIIIDFSNSNQVLQQLDALDDLLGLDVPIVCIADAANSFELEELQNRHFNVWRWNNMSLSPELCGDESKALGRRLANCAFQTVEYSYVQSSVLNEVMRSISAQRRDVTERSPQMMQVFEMLNRFAFAAIRETAGFSKAHSEQAEQKLLECLNLLERERMFLPPSVLEDYHTAIDGLMRFYEDGNLPKRFVLEDKLREFRGKSVILIVPEHVDREHIYRYWDAFLEKNVLDIELNVLSPSEYLSGVLPAHDVAIVIGWLRRDIMRRIIYSYHSKQYVILLYECEKRWCGHDVRQWHRILKQTNNKDVIERTISSGSHAVELSITDLLDPVPQVEASDADEQEEISKIIQDNRYKRYAGNTHSGSEPVEALPVNFIGDCIAFFKKGHSLISATRIITEDAEKIETIIPERLQIGDFIVLRDTARDLIREMADHILTKSGKESLRALAIKWKESVKIALIFNEIDEFYENLKAAGCTKGLQTVRNWIYDDQLIAPQDKEDLGYIAKASGDGVLLDLQDKIFDAAKEVKAAHTQAGMNLSRLLRARIAEELRQMGDIDPYNIWEPLELELEDIGKVRILKVIDVNDHRFMMVDASDTNKLMFIE